MIEILGFDYKNNVNEVLIYGGTFWAQIVVSEFKKNGINIKGIFDKYRAGLMLEGTEIRIKTPEEMINYKNTPVVVCSTAGFRSMCDFLEKLGFTQAYHAGIIFEYADWSQIQGWDVYDKDEMIGKYMKHVYTYKGEKLDEIEFSVLNLNVLDACNLKCDKCLVRCADIAKKRIDPVDEVIRNLEKILSQIQCIYKVILCGGEVFLYSQLKRLLQFCISSEKIKRIELLTNATVIPNDELLDMLTNPKVRFVLDNYHLPAQKIDKIKEACDAHGGIDYQVKTLEYWHDLTISTQPVNCYDIELQELFRECTEAQNYTLADNKLINCFRTYVDFECGDWPADKNDYYIDLNEFEKGDERLKDEILKLLSNKYIERCKYCYGTGKDARRIPVAVQRQR